MLSIREKPLAKKHLKKVVTHNDTLVEKINSKSRPIKGSEIIIPEEKDEENSVVQSPAFA